MTSPSANVRASRTCRADTRFSLEVDVANLELLAVHRARRTQPASDESGCRNGGPGS